MPILLLPSSLIATVPFQMGTHAPAWVFLLALHFLNGPPFEPLGEASLRDLTTMAVFLLRFALGARVCVIRGLSGEVVFGS